MTETEQENTESRKIREIFKRTQRLSHIGRKINGNGLLTGSYRNAFRGNGIEFDQVREYSDGDESRLIDWNVTARLNHAYVKTFIEERNLNIVFLVDVSASMAFSSAGLSKRESAAEICAAIGMQALAEHDRTGLILFSREPEKTLPPGTGQHTLMRIVREVLFHNAAHAGTDIHRAIDYALKVLKTPSVIMLIGDFYDKLHRISLNKLAAKHRLFLFNLSAEIESDFPDTGIIEFDDPETGRRMIADTSNPEWRKQLQQNKEQMQTALNNLRGRHIHICSINSSQNISVQLEHFFRYRIAG